MNSSHRSVVRFSSPIGSLIMVVATVLLALYVIPKLIGKSGSTIPPVAADMSVLSCALQNFRLDCDRYPNAQEGLEALIKMPASLKGRWKGPYLPQLHRKDPWGNPYVYLPTRHDSYELISYGADGRPGGEGEDADIIESSL